MLYSFGALHFEMFTSGFQILSKRVQWVGSSKIQGQHLDLTWKIILWVKRFLEVSQGGERPERTNWKMRKWWREVEVPIFIKLVKRQALRHPLTRVTTLREKHLAKPWHLGNTKGEVNGMISLWCWPRKVAELRRENHSKLKSQVGTPHGKLS